MLGEMIVEREKKILIKIAFKWKKHVEKNSNASYNYVVDPMGCGSESSTKQ
jgi:hypothetical protein